MRRLFSVIEQIAATDATVLIEGETGSGKELVAEALHEGSARTDEPFVVVDCSAVSANLVESELFGHVKGAFTGAIKSTPGVFEAAHGGTLFLDELGELPLEVQAKLLRAIETRRVRRLGGSKLFASDVRIIAATNRDLATEVNRGTFRADLYYRLAVARLAVPSLRERREDIPLLIEHFLDQLSLTVRNARLPDDFLARAQRHAWPGNVRELRNAIERALLLPDHAQSGFEPPPARPAGFGTVDISVPFKTAKQDLVDEFDRRYLRAMLEAHDGNISAAARAAGIERMSIYKMIRRLGLDKGGEDRDGDEEPTSSERAGGDDD